MQTQSIPRLAYRAAEVAEAFGVSTRQIRRYIACGKLRAITLSGGVTLIPVSEIDRLLKGEQ